MRYLLVLILLFSGCTKVVEKIVYKCPEGQVKVLEEGKEKCYTPGISYTDYRPLQVKVIE